MCSLIRDGNKTTQLANVLVPGDLITFSTGDRIPADIRLTAAQIGRASCRERVS